MLTFLTYPPISTCYMLGLVGHILAGVKAIFCPTTSATWPRISATWPKSSDNKKRRASVYASARCGHYW